MSPWALLPPSPKELRLGIRRLLARQRLFQGIGRHDRGAQGGRSRDARDGRGPAGIEQNLAEGKSRRDRARLPDGNLRRQARVETGQDHRAVAAFRPGTHPGRHRRVAPGAKILFAGDIVYTERMLAIIPLSHTGGWVQAFDKLVALKPRVVVPGHGKPTDLKRAKKGNPRLPDHRTRQRQEGAGRRRLVAGRGGKNQPVKIQISGEFRAARRPQRKPDVSGNGEGRVLTSSMLAF